MAMIELVDFNELLLAAKADAGGAKKKRTRRSSAAVKAATTTATESPIDPDVDAVINEGTEDATEA